MRNRAKYQSLFFDLDDTLWDTYHNNKECLEEMYNEYNFGRHYPSFTVFFDTSMRNNLFLLEKYMTHEIDRQTLILDRLLYILRPLGLTDQASALHLNQDFLLRTPQ